MQRDYRQGDIYWLDNCEPIHGDISKRRPVIVVSTATMADKSGGLLVVVACTSTVYPDDVEAIELPNRMRMPRTHTGLNKRTWAIPYWFLVVKSEQLTDRAGYISGKLLDHVVARYQFYFDLERRKD